MSSTMTSLVASVVLISQNILYARACFTWLDRVGLFWGFYVTFTVFQWYRDLWAWDTQSLNSKWQDPGSNPVPLLCKARAFITIPPPPLPVPYNSLFNDHYLNSYSGNVSYHGAKFTNKIFENLSSEDTCTNGTHLFSHASESLYRCLQRCLCPNARL